MVKTARRRRDAAAPSRDQLAQLKDSVYVATCGLFADGGLRIRYDRLDPDSVGELFALTRKAEQAAHEANPQASASFSLATLRHLSDGERERWEELVSRAAGAPGAFARVREDASLARDVREIARRAFRRPVSRDEEKGLLGELDEQIADGFLFADHVALLLLIVVQMASGRPFKESVRIAPGPALVVDANAGGPIGGNVDPEGTFAAWKTLLQHLERNSWFEVDRVGPKWTIRPGRRLERALARGAA